MSGNTVWLASYPKSGNTWFRSVFAALRREDPFALDAADPIASNRAQFDQALGLSSSDLTASETLRLRPLADDQLDLGSTEPHLQKIHDSLFSGADGAPVVSIDATRAAIYLVRDPRDVAVSFAHHMDHDIAAVARQLCSPAMAIGTHDRDFGAQNRQHLGRWADHVTGWVDQTRFPVHVVRYEDCLSDPIASFGAALSFAGFEIDADELVSAVEATSFARLQERERVDGFRERWGRGSPFFRRGVAGGWRDELDEEQAALIESVHREVMVRFGYLEAAEADGRCAERTASSTTDSDCSA